MTLQLTKWLRNIEGHNVKTSLHMYISVYICAYEAYICTYKLADFCYEPRAIQPSRHRPLRTVELPAVIPTRWSSETSCLVVLSSSFLIAWSMIFRTSHVSFVGLPPDLRSRFIVLWTLTCCFNLHTVCQQVFISSMWRILIVSDTELFSNR